VFSLGRADRGLRELPTPSMLRVLGNDRRL
jgi:hypothetical protein